MTEQLQLQWHTDQRKINDLIPFEGNPRELTKQQAVHLRESLEKFNLVDIPAIDTNGTIVSGHQRLAMLKLMGRGNETIDVRLPNRPLTPAERKEYLLRANQNTGRWDKDALAHFDADFLKDVGFNANFVSALSGETDGLFDTCPTCGRRTKRLAGQKKGKS